MLKNKRVLVVGNGLTGKAVFKKVFELGGVAEYYEEDKDLSLNNYDLSVISPGISRREHTYIRLKGSGIPIYSEVDFAYLTNPFNAISITGTNGKTTVVNLVNGMLNSAGISATPVGNVGVPFCEAPKADWWVSEVSSFMLEQSKFFKSMYSTITNIEPDHKEYHITFERYRRAKLKLLKMTERGVVYNADYIKRELIPRNLDVIRYSIEDKTADIYVDNNKICYRENGKIFELLEIASINLVGKHNLENIMNAFGLSIMSNGYRKEYTEFVKAYKGEAYRLVYCGIKNGKKIYNDSKGTNVSAVISAYKCMNGRTALILGGYDKKESYKPLFKVLQKGDIALISGDNGDTVSKEAGKCNVIHYHCKTLEEAIVRAVNSDTENVLFSPGCSSYDRFANFEERGKFFDEFIEKIKL